MENDHITESVAVPMGCTVEQDWDTKKWVCHLDLQVKGFDTEEAAHRFYRITRRSALLLKRHIAG